MSVFIELHVVVLSFVGNPVFSSITCSAAMVRFFLNYNLDKIQGISPWTNQEETSSVSSTSISSTKKEKKRKAKNLCNL